MPHLKIDNLESEVVGGACGAPDGSTTHRVCHSIH